MNRPTDYGIEAWKADQRVSEATQAIARKRRELAELEAYLPILVRAQGEAHERLDRAREAS